MKISLTKKQSEIIESIRGRPELLFKEEHVDILIDLADDTVRNLLKEVEKKTGVKLPNKIKNNIQRILSSTIEEEFLAYAR